MKYIFDYKEKYVEILNPDSVLDCYILERQNTMADTCNLIKTNSHGNNVIYFLYNDNEPKNTSHKRKFYIGETTNLYDRMIDHRNNPKKDWWTHVIVFTGDKRKLNETTIMALEHLLIDAYKKSDLYDLDNSKDSNKDTDNDYDTKFFYILELLSIRGYPLKGNEPVKEVTEKENAKNNEFSDLILDSLIDKIPDIKFDQMQLYKSFYVYVNNQKVPLFALWSSNEAELYAECNSILDIAPDAYSTVNRRRGNRKSAIKVKTKKDIESLCLVAQRIIDNFKNND